MSGIFGSTKIYDENTLRKKLDVFKFRGPDYVGIKNYEFQDNKLVLGCNVLSVEHNDFNVQPFEYNEGNITVVLDGTIYNADELKSQYFKDIVFKGSSCCELLAALYIKFGKECVKYINGDFAFVIYDKKNQLLYGARDRVGEKPFYYHVDENCFEFASQLFPLCIGNKYTINDKARQYYFALQYIPDPISILNEVQKLNAGDYLIYSLTDKTLSVIKYWDLYTNSCNFQKPHSFDEAVEYVDLLLKDSVSKRYDEKAVTGTFLSGGIDSSLITMYASMINPDVEAFSMGFNESDFDESEYSRKVADCLGIKYNHVVCSSDEAIKVIDNLQHYYDEPMGDASMIPTSLLTEKARGSMSVALGGDGGDEVFFGYPRYLRYASREWVYKFPKFVRNGTAYLLDKSGKHRAALSLRMNDVRDLYINRRVFSPAESFDALKLQQNMPDYHYLYDNECDVRKSFNDFDIKTLMNYAYNTKLDRAAARSSLDVRTPMMDYRLVEYSRLLPVEYMYNKGVGQKRILRTLLYKSLPREIFERKKSGFGVPINKWFRNELKDYVLDNLNENTAKFMPEYDSKLLLRMRDDHIRGVKDYKTYIWLCLNYIAWKNSFDKLGK